MSSSDTLSPPEEFVQALLREAGVHDPPDSLSLLGVSTCRVWALTAGGQRYVVRSRLDADAQLARKEVYLSALLRQHDVPAPDVLAAVTGERGVGTLSLWLPGIRLDHALASLPATDLGGAWRATGEVLRIIHAIVLPAAGEIVGERVDPFPGGWAQWVIGDLAEDIGRLQAGLRLPTVSLSLLERVGGAAIGALEGAPVRLVHNDALPQNVLLAPGPEGWRCTGWLDWEFARAADPLWDLGTLDFRPAGLVPSSFYEGYGAHPVEPQVSIYELLMALWRTRAELEHGAHWSWPPQRARLDYLHSLPERIDRLAELLGVRS